VGVINRTGRFATEGVRFQRLNGDGTIPRADRFLGFAGTVDLSGVLENDKATLAIKIDSEPARIAEIDFSDVADETKVTVEESITALTDSSLTGLAWSKDTKTTRLKGAATASGAKVIQIYGDLAAALDFGQSLKHGGEGLKVISFFDDETISIGLPKDIIDKEEIDIEGAKGTINRMVIGARTQGLSPVVALKEKDYNLLELIQGGKLDRKAGTYDPPLSGESDHPSFYAEIFSPIYSAGTSKLSDVTGYEKLLLRSMQGIEGEVPIETKAWAQYAYNLTATEYTDENGKKYPAWQEQTITLEEFDAMKVKDI